MNRNTSGAEASSESRVTPRGQPGADRRSRGFPRSTAVPAVWFGIVLTLYAAGPAHAQHSPARHVDEARLRETLEHLSQYGRNPEGGVSRVGFSDADIAGREYVMGLMRDAGLEVRIDAAGNIFGHRAGTADLPLLLFGSHIDSVPHGGNFDGDVGSLSAIEVIRALQENKITTRHPLAVVIWTNEEGGRFYSGLFGSSAAAGLVPRDTINRRDDKGETLAEWLKKYGGDPSHLEAARIPSGKIAGYLELHIEQGAVLDEAKIPIGVVQGIVGISQRICTAAGFANHAGTTPMNLRRDALLAASRAALAVRDEVRAQPGAQVGTVGWMKVEPGAANVIPGRVTFPVELRDLQAAKFAGIGERILQRLAAISREEHVTIECTKPEVHEPALATPAFRSAIKAAAESAGLSTRDLPSGAGHDAQNVARYAPMGMIFVPSRGGISHSPLEFTPYEQIANGAEVLYRTLLLLDQ
ncbi:MAG TPA: M20 family metallo-hydrolase [Candidatus Dormibacteraeota bacterium]|nr:M20 family metallo-hydrolase [Candidatus Dormibacteraeota bacterium]